MLAGVVLSRQENRWLVTVVVLELIIDLTLDVKLGKFEILLVEILVLVPRDLLAEL